MLIPLTPVRRRPWAASVKAGAQHSKSFPYLSGEQALFSSAREALYHGLSLLASKPGKIHLPAYCCKSILLPISNLGIEVSFYDIGERLEPLLNKGKFSKGDVFLLVHFFGIPQDVLLIERFCKEHGMLLVEDCAHTLPDPEAGMPMGSTGIFSIYSLRKMLPVPDGGVLVVNDMEMQDRVRHLTPPVLSRLSFRRWAVNNLDRFAFTFGWPNTILIKDILRDRFSSSDAVFNGLLSVDALPEINRITVSQLREFKMKELRDARRNNYLMFADLLSGVQGVTIPFSLLPESSFPQAFPIMYDNAQGLCRYLHRKGIGAGQWPGEELPGSLSISEYPGTVPWVKKLILLPSHQDIASDQINMISEIIKEAVSSKILI